MDAATRRVTVIGCGLAGSLIGAVRRRGDGGARRTPDRLLLEHASGMPGPALVDPLADFDVVLAPEAIDRRQARELAVEAGKVALQGVARRLSDAARSLRPGAGATEPTDAVEAVAPAEQPAERAAWERFVVALERVTDLRAAYAVECDELAAERLRWAEVELEDAVAVAGEFGVKNLRWLLT